MLMIYHEPEINFNVTVCPIDENTKEVNPIPAGIEIVAVCVAEIADTTISFSVPSIPADKEKLILEATEEFITDVLNTLDTTPEEIISIVSLQVGFVGIFENNT